MQISTGSYVGDGTDGRIIPTGNSGASKQVVINRIGPAAIIGSPTSFAFLKTESDLLDSCAEFATKPLGGITFSGADFIVDASAGNANNVGESYNWTAWSE